jgi:EpsI family protein
VPNQFGRWRSQDVGDPLALNPGTLASRLYNQLVTRLYTDPERQLGILMLLAHGEKQSDELQLHRPEICYPAFGYALLKNEPSHIQLGHAVTIPSRRLLAQSEDHQEAIVYWTRLGEYLPISGSEQREDRFRNAIAGLIPDGVLCRFSATTQDPTATWGAIQSFVVELLGAMPTANRAVLIGSERARAVTA